MRETKYNIILYLINQGIPYRYVGEFPATMEEVKAVKANLARNKGGAFESRDYGSIIIPDQFAGFFRVEIEAIPDENTIDRL